MRKRERERLIRDSLRALWFSATGRMPHRPSRLECSHSRDPRHAVAFVWDQRDPGVGRPNLLAGVWHTPEIAPEQWLYPAVMFDRWKSSKEAVDTVVA
ncbi:hypothetical protein DMB38_20475 [Streptomyces sp. WAC 06738]|uniref:hypothetical protein n=1 Tax=Streptomyces sp. WAC 06738 TaxID=2203210 RepID=UPI000F6FA5EE|nr:hypothetical protein [Streptomyces sp. WAC 06738]AZM47846.1 hypothetical protein DMB38_20475 [Streptomyces sp. WAC 06738]